LGGEGRLNEGVRQETGRESRPDEQGLAFEPVQETPLVMAEVAHLRAEKVTRSHLAGDRTRRAEGGFMLPLRHREAEIGVELPAANGFGLEQQVAGYEQPIGDQLLVDGKLELEAKRLLAVAAGLGMAAPFRLGRDRQSERKHPAVEDSVFCFG